MIFDIYFNLEEFGCPGACAVNVSETCPGLLEKRAMGISYEWMF